MILSIFTSMLAFLFVWWFIFVSKDNSFISNDSSFISRDNSFISKDNSYHYTEIILGTDVLLYNSLYNNSHTVSLNLDLLIFSRYKCKKMQKMCEAIPNCAQTYNSVLIKSVYTWMISMKILHVIGHLN